MRFNGSNLEKRTVSLTLPNRDEAITLTITGIPLGWELDFAKLYPQPPKRFRSVVSNGRTTSQEVTPDSTVDEDEREHCKTAYRIYLALKSDKNIEFENKPVDADSMKKLAEEIKNSFLMAGDCALILTAAGHAACMDTKTFDKAIESFA